MTVNLKVWRQAGPKEKGEFRTYTVETDTDTSFLETLDILNEQLVNNHEEPIAFDHDCREGICGMCSLYINGHPHGPATGATTCQLYMRRFKDGETITVEPWRSAAFPVIKDLMVNRNAFDQIQQPAAMYRSTAEAHRMPTISPSPRSTPTWLWTLLHASAVAHVWLLVRTALQCSSFLQR